MGVLPADLDEEGSRKGRLQGGQQMGRIEIVLRQKDQFVCECRGKKPLGGFWELRRFRNSVFIPRVVEHF